MPNRFTTLISAAELDKALTDPDLILFDCRFDLADTARGRRDYQASHIPNAVYAHLDEHLSSPITSQTGRHPLPDPAKLIDWLKACGVTNSSQVIAYGDAGGVMAVRIWWLLRWLGHTDVAVLDGGWQAWSKQQGAISNEPPSPTPSSHFDTVIDNNMVVTTETISADLHAPSRQWLLLDARTPERYRGEREPIDPIAGHIPGAVNLPLQQHLDSQGRFLPADQLHALYQPVLGQHAPEFVACYCGSGVTACHNLLAMEIAGIKGGRLYAGSWSEWIRNSANPIALAER